MVAAFFSGIAMCVVVEVYTRAVQLDLAQRPAASYMDVCAGLALVRLSISGDA